MASLKISSKNSPQEEVQDYDCYETADEVQIFGPPECSVLRPRSSERFRLRRQDVSFLKNSHQLSSVPYRSGSRGEQRQSPSKVSISATKQRSARRWRNDAEKFGNRWQLQKQVRLQAFGSEEPAVMDDIEEGIPITNPGSEHRTSPQGRSRLNRSRSATNRQGYSFLFFD